MDNNIEKIIKEKKSILNEELEQVSGGEGGKKKKYRVDGYTKTGRLMENHLMSLFAKPLPVDVN